MYDFISKIFFPIVVSQKLFIEAKFFSHFRLVIDSLNKQLSSINTIYQLIKSQWKPFKWFALVIYWLLIPSPMFSALWANVPAETILNKFLFSGCISLAASVKCSLMNSSLNGFPCLANKWATQKLALTAASFPLFNFCEEILLWWDTPFAMFYFFPGGCFPVRWEYYDPSFVW